MKRDQWPKIVVFDFRRMTVTVNDVVSSGSMVPLTFTPKPK
jgi:hypothetical protein